jgi:tetraacyldisaccharide-1-P 4'-kinase
MVEHLKGIIRRADRAGAGALVTTEKDRVNFAVVPPSFPPCFYCRIEMVMEDEPAFFAAVAQHLEESTG